MTDSGDAGEDQVEVSARLRRWIESQFAPETAPAVVAALRAMPTAAYGGQDPERIHAAHVLGTDGDWNLFELRRDLARLDWRDLLVVGGLGDGGWSERLVEKLGSPAGGETIPTSDSEQGGDADDQHGER